MADTNRPNLSEMDADVCFFEYFGPEDTFEDLHGYKYHGFHPIVLGDILPKAGMCASAPDSQPRYRIHCKIGFGAFSTVWLAYDLLEKLGIRFRS